MYFFVPMWWVCQLLVVIWSPESIVLILWLKRLQIYARPHMQLIVFQWTKIVLSLCYQLTNLHGRALLNYLKHRDQRTSMFLSFWMYPKNCCTLRGWGTSLPSPYNLPSFHIPGAVHLDSVIMWQSIKFRYLYVQRAIFTDNHSREVVLREYNPQLRHSWLIQQLLLIF